MDTKATVSTSTRPGEIAAHFTSAELARVSAFHGSPWYWAGRRCGWGLDDLVNLEIRKNSVKIGKVQVSAGEES